MDDSASSELEIAPPHLRSRPAEFILQLGHRASSIGLFLLIAGAVVLWMHKEPGRALLPAAFIAAEIGLVCGFIVWWLGRQRDADPAEERGLLIFSLCLISPTVVLLILMRIGIV